MDIFTNEDKLCLEQGLPLPKYDIFIMFADKDVQFATQIFEQMEQEGYKVCVQGRDVIGESDFIHYAVTRLVAERCRRLMVICSPAFIESPHNDFISEYVETFDPPQRKNKIIPCTYGDSDEIPEAFENVHLLNYVRSLQFNNFWDKLWHAMKRTPAEENNM